MIDLDTSDQLIRNDIACMIAILADDLEYDDDLNKSRDELRQVVERLAYLVVDEGECANFNYQRLDMSISLSLRDCLTENREMCKQEERQIMTDGERLFCDYFMENRIDHQRIEKESVTRPDFYAYSRAVVIEVKDDEDGPADLEHLEEIIIGKPNAKRMSVGVPKIRKKVSDTLKKFAGEPDIPCVAGLYFKTFMPRQLETTIQAALYGDWLIAVSLRGDNEAWFFRDDSTLNEDGRPAALFNRSDLAVISAVAVIEEVVPDYLIKRRQEVMDESDPLKSLGNLEELDKRLYAERGSDFKPRVLRSRVYHNPNAIVHLPENVFSAEHDTHFKGEHQNPTRS